MLGSVRFLVLRERRILQQLPVLGIWCSESTKYHCYLKMVIQVDSSMRIADSLFELIMNYSFCVFLSVYTLRRFLARRALFSVVPRPRIPEKTLYHRRSSRTRLVTQLLGCLWMQQMAWYKERKFTMSSTNRICNSFLCHKPLSLPCIFQYDFTDCIACFPAFMCPTDLFEGKSLFM